MALRIWTTIVALGLGACSGSGGSKRDAEADAPAAGGHNTSQTAVGTGSADQAAAQNSVFINGSAATPTSEAAAIAMAASDAAADAKGADARYFSLSYLQVNKVSSQDRLVVRKAVGKLLNSLSWAPGLTVPPAVDQGGLLLKIHLQDFGWSALTWEALTVRYPELSSGINGLAALSAATGSAKPVIRAEWFVNNVSLAPLYYTVLGLPTDFKQLQAKLNLDVGTDVVNQAVIRSGFDKSVVSTNDRVAERHAVGSTGFFWRSYEFGTKSGNQDIFHAPLGPVRYFAGSSPLGPLGNGLRGHPPGGPFGNKDPDLNADHMFADDGGEVYFTLPNGLLAFYITNGSDQRLDQVPGAKEALFAGASCMSCHAHGPIPKTDMVAPAAASLGLSAAEQAAVAKMYVEPAAFNQQVSSDNKAYQASLDKIGVSDSDGDPISAVGRMNINENQ